MPACPCQREAMKPTLLLDRATTDDGKCMTLHEHDGTIFIRIDGLELMSTRQHHSEERLAELACGELRETPHPRVLIGGLGLGFTLRAALACLPPGAAVIVVELVPAVIAWNREPAYKLGCDALQDPRVEVIVGDVADVLHAQPNSFDAVILDVDNGATGLTAEANSQLYDTAGLSAASAALKPTGCLAVWSAVPDPVFVERMGRCGFAVVTERVPCYPGGTASNWLFIGRRTTASRVSRRFPTEGLPDRPPSDLR